MKPILRRGLLYPAAIMAALVGLLFWFFNRYDLSVQVEPSPAPPVVSPPPTSVLRSPTATLTPLPTPSPQPTAPNSPAPTGNSTSAATAVRLGKLRVANPTDYPVRLVLRRQLSDRPNNFDEPIHWDFAPQEGGQAGLLLALPSGNLQIRQGDVLVAIAQDGSQRYWGPYIVGQTAGVEWNPERNEWRLILQP